jgi:hypothetical protein
MMMMTTRKVRMLLTVMLLAFSMPFHSYTYSASVALSEDEQADLLFMREEEKLARDTYLTLYAFYESQGLDLSVFSNIASSEQSHMDAILRLLKKYKLPDPAAGNEIGEFTDEELQHLYDFLIDMGDDSGLAALKVGGIIEETDMEDIKAAIERSEKADIDAVYESLLCGSRNHLRSFAQNIEAMSGESYEALVLEQGEVDEILESPMEKCGRASTTAKDVCKGKCLGLIK